MSKRASWPPGVPCFVGVICPDDAEAAKEFYRALFGWSYANLAGPADPPFYLATLHGDRAATVAGSGNGEPGAWVTAVAVADREQAAQRVRDAGGSAPADDTTEIISVGRFHRVHDPAGAEIHLAQIEGTAVERVDEPGAWSMSTLRVAEPASVTPFYQAVFGWRAEEFGSAKLFRLPRYSGGQEPRRPVPADAVGRLEQAPLTRGLDTGWMPDFRVDDIDSALDAAVRHGGQVVGGPEADHLGVRNAILADPGGATFSVSRPA